MKNNDGFFSYFERLNKLQWLVLFITGFLTYLAWDMTLSLQEEQNQARFEKEANQIVNLISERMQKYEDTLLGGVSAIQIHSEEVRTKLWRDYADTLNINKRYPGIKGIGIIYKVDRKDRDTFVKKMSKDIPEFNIFPEHSNLELFPIVYIEPLLENLKAQGLDVAHEKNRYEAAKKAADTGTTQLTAPIVLVQDAKKTPGFLLYAPFYKNKNNRSFEDRQKNFEGFVYAPFIANKLLHGVLEEGQRYVSVEIQDEQEVLYSEKDLPLYDSAPSYKKNIEKQIYGRKWNFIIHSHKDFLSFSTFTQANLILLGGALIAIILLMIFSFQSKLNATAVMYAKEMSKDLALKAQALEESNENIKAEYESRKKAETQISEALKAKSVFLANMSHEIRTPLNGIIGLTQVIDTQKLDKQAAEDIIQIRESSLSLLQIVNDVLDITKLNEGRVEIDNHPFELKALFETVINLFKVSLSQNDLEIKLDIQEGLDTNFFGDPYHLRQILMNLIGNAIKFTHKGQIEISISKVNNLDQESQFLRCDVKDSGIGISEEALSRLFQPFEQADKSTSREFGGTGLGLSISKGLVELMGGEIWCESETGVGSTFSFTFKVKRAKESDIKSIHESLQQLELGELKILLVEDNSINQLVAKRLLDKIGIKKVELATNGQEALEKAQENKYDIILMDIQMPIMDGIEATRKIRGFDKDVNIIGLSANAFLEDKQNAISAGMNDYIEKPIHLGTLLEKINSTLS